MRAFVTAALLVASAAPAASRGRGSSAARQDETEVSIALGGGVGLGVLEATLRAGDRTWSTSGAAGAVPILVGQAAGTDDRYYFDFTTGNYEGIVASVRLFWAAEGDDTVLAGTFAVRDLGAWPIVCDIG